MSFSFYRARPGKYLAITAFYRAEISTASTGRKLLSITNRLNDTIVFRESGVSVQSCKSKANDFLAHHAKGGINHVHAI